ncbi:MAG: ORF6N domain-containing protein [Proteobacteria bacterium]|nr:ORF6N domain-containing protein [Pseudomonadota bacterium]
MSKEIIPVEHIESKILFIRGQRVMLDSDLAAIYGVPTRRLNEQVKRNIRKFPPDFVFRLTNQEVKHLKSQIVISKGAGNRSQIATGSQKHRDPRFLPYAFTEHGAIMAANVLRDLARKLAELERKLTTRLNVHETAITEVLQQIMRLLNPPEEPEPQPTPRKRIGFTAQEKSVKYSVQ